eukprot:6461424-Amphidinium_carterae.2
MEYLEIWNGWSRECVQGRPTAPIGVTAGNYAEEDRHKMFVNESGLVPGHMPWIIATAVAWMGKYPCLPTTCHQLRETSSTNMADS